MLHANANLNLWISNGVQNRVCETLANVYSEFAQKSLMKFAVVSTHPRCSESRDTFDCHTYKDNPSYSPPAKR